MRLSALNLTKNKMTNKRKNSVQKNSSFSSQKFILMLKGWIHHFFTLDPSFPLGSLIDPFPSQNFTKKPKITISRLFSFQFPLIIIMKIFPMENDFLQQLPHRDLQRCVFLIQKSPFEHMKVIRKGDIWIKSYFNQKNPSQYNGFIKGW